MNDALTLLDIAAAAVRLATQACRAVQAQIRPETLEKKDKSPVTVADFASQALVCARLAEATADIPVVGEEGTADLRGPEQAPLRAAVVKHVAAVLGRPVDEATVLGWIDRGGTGLDAEGNDLKQPLPPRYWTLDPIDGTKGFLRREQYAVALALIEGGRVVLGALACPGLEAPGAGQPGLLMLAAARQGTRQAALAGTTGWGQAAVVKPGGGGVLRFCESVESGHSDQEASARIAARLGITAAPVRMDSQAKYAAVARNDAGIYLRLPTRPGYEEKIWDHAAGMLMVAEAGGTVSDLDGKPLDFSRGRTLSGNRGIVATQAVEHARVLAAVRG